ncbi:MAG: type III-B CRISPR module RAMP protein Cmr4 [Leptolyngbyaceae cyanobacterium SM2_5_2]|nr:type III-B CRISPR module RAMP protein Cmr4 [Leptolyngbyaceae cyanobacterium SM2_5_2]
MIENLVYLYLLSPLHTGGTTQEGNLLGIARESHTELPYIPSSSIRGRLRASMEPAEKTDIDAKLKQISLFGSEIDDQKNEALVTAYKAKTNKDLNQLVQGTLWIGDGSILWLPVPSLSHGVVWVSSPLLLQRWKRWQDSAQGLAMGVPEYSTNLKNGKPVYLKDAILKDSDLQAWNNWQSFIPTNSTTADIKQVLVLPDKHSATLIQMALWRQVKIKLDEHKTVDGGFRYEEAIPPDTLMYFPWGITSQANGKGNASKDDFENLLAQHEILQIGGQESLGRGFVQTWLASN